MKKKILPFFMCLLTLTCFGQYTVRVAGNIVEPDKEDGHLKIYVLNGFQDVEVSYTDTDNAQTHQWKRYTTHANYSTNVSSTREPGSNTSILNSIIDGSGYFVGGTNNTSTGYLWFIDYSKYTLNLESISIDRDVEECEDLKLLIDIDADGLLYYTPDGRGPLEVARKFSLEYVTMDQSQKEEGLYYFAEKHVIMNDISGNNREIIIDAPLKNTTFTLSGDQFAEKFGTKKSVSTEEYQAVAVQAYLDYETDADETPGTSLSAPAHYTFTAYATEAAVFYKWEVYNKKISVTDPVTIANTSGFDYTFEQDGEYKVVLQVSNNDASCIFEDSLITLNVGTSYVRIPNIFTPYTQDGINDELIVRFKSVLSFKGWIYNRWGNQVFYWTDPEQGWDGKHKGKLVPPGVYFVVIEYTGTDGKKHVAKRDVTIIGGKKE